MRSASAIAATARSVWLSGWRLGKFIRPAAIGGREFGCVLMTAACSSSASSISRASPAGVRARRSAIRSGESAATRSFAASATAPESACGAAASVSCGTRERAVMVVDGALLELAVGDDHHRTVGGVIAIL